MKLSSTSSTNLTFKMLYIIAIFMVVDGHLGSINYLTLNDFMPYQNYHLSLFIFTSGYFLNLQKNYKDFITSKLKHLILPLYCWNIIYGLLCLYLNSNYNFSIGLDFNLHNIFISPLTDGHQFIYNMASWFIVPLFFLQLISYIVLKPFSQTKKHNLSQISIIFFILSLTLSCLVLTPITTSPHNTRDFTLTFLRIMYFLPSFSFGFLFRHFLEKKDKLPTELFFPLIISIYTLLIIKYPNHIHTPSWLNDLQSPPLALFLISFCAILFWHKIAYLLSPLIKKSKTLNLIANNTFSIMMHHFIGFMLLKSILSLISTNFNHTAFKQNIWYMDYPYSEEILTPIYFIITLVITLLIVFTKQRIYDTITTTVKHLPKFKCFIGRE